MCHNLHSQQNNCDVSFRGRDRWRLMQMQFPEMQALPLTRLPCLSHLDSEVTIAATRRRWSIRSCLSTRSRLIKTPADNSRRKGLPTSSAAVVLCENFRVHLASNHVVRQNIPCLSKDLSCNSGLPAVGPASNSSQTGPSWCHLKP
jgi:hypothetical protein